MALNFHCFPIHTHSVYLPNISMKVCHKINKYVYSLTTRALMSSCLDPIWRLIVIRFMNFIARLCMSQSWTGDCEQCIIILSGSDHIPESQSTVIGNCWFSTIYWGLDRMCVCVWSYDFGDAVELSVIAYKSWDSRFIWILIFRHFHV